MQSFSSRIHKLAYNLNVVLKWPIEVDEMCGHETQTLSMGVWNSFQGIGNRVRLMKLTPSLSYKYYVMSSKMYTPSVQ